MVINILKRSSIALLWWRVKRAEMANGQQKYAFGPILQQYK